MSGALQSQYNTFRKTTKLWLYTVGVRPSKKHNLFFYVLPYIHMSLCILPLYGVFNTFRINISNVLIVARSIGPIVGFMTIFTKVMCIIVNREKICELHVFLDNYFEDVLKNTQAKKIVLNGVSSFRRMPLVVVILTGTTCLLFSVTPVIFIIQQKFKNVDNIKYILPYPTVYPWKIPPASLLYLFHLVTQCLSNLSIFYITASVDTFYAFHIFQMTSILRNISHNLVNNENTVNREFVVRECLIQYNIVLKCRDKLEKIYGLIILWTMGTNAILLCGLAFQITHLKSVSAARIILFIVHGGMKTVQIFMYNWAGTRLTEESEIYRVALYTSNWLESKKLMKTIAIALGQKPLILKACSYLTVSLDMFVYVMNATVSYFVFLQTVEQS